MRWDGVWQKEKQAEKKNDIKACEIASRRECGEQAEKQVLEQENQQIEREVQ